MADNKGTSIKNSAHVSEIKDTHKVPVSDGTGTPKHITLGDLKVTPTISIGTEELTDEYLNLEIGIVHKDPQGKKIKDSYRQFKFEPATQSTAGLMSASDKQKLDEMEDFSRTYNTKEETLTDDSKIPVSNANGNLLYITLGDIKKYLGLIKQYFTLGSSRLNGQDVLK